MLILSRSGAVVGQKDADAFVGDLVESAEDLLLAKEAYEAGEVDEGPRRPIRSKKEIHEALAKLSESERTAIQAYFAGGQAQRAIALQLGVSQPSVTEMIQRAIARLRWIMGPGGRLTVDDLRQTYRSRLPGTHLHALEVFWTTSNQREVHRQLSVSRDAARRILARSIASLDQGHRRIFEALMRNARLMQRGQGNQDVRPFSALRDFLARIVVFDRTARVARDTLFATYERHARAHQRPVSLPKLVEELSQRQVSSGAVRLSGRNVSGYLGCDLRREVEKDAWPRPITEQRA